MNNQSVPSTKKYEDNPFEDAVVAKEWINSIESDGVIRNRELLPMLKKWVEEVAPSVIVDIGMGQGGCADSVQSGPQIKYIGIDSSVFLVDRAKEIHAKENREFIVGNAYDLPVQDGIADAALLMNVLFHLKDLATGMKELARVLKEGGGFLICTANPEAYPEWQSRFDKGAKIDDKVIDGKVHVRVNPISRNLFFKHSMGAMMEAFEKSGLQVDRRELKGIYDGCKAPLFVIFIGHKG